LHDKLPGGVVILYAYYSCTMKLQVACISRTNL